MRKTITNFVLKLIHKRKAEWEGSTIRSSRLRKFKKRSKGIAIAAQVIAIWYLFIFAGSYLTSYTGAYFNDIETIENFLGAADEFPGDPDEWDRSSLSFTNVGGFCSQGFEGKLYSELANVGDEDMEGPTTFYIYKKTNGSPNKNDSGELVHQGEVPPLVGKKGSPNNKTVLVFSPDLSTMTPGTYKFKADQRPGHSNPNHDPDKETDHETWGEEIKVTQADIDECKTVITPQEPPAEIPNVSEVMDLKESHDANTVKLTWSNPSENFAYVKVYRNGELLEDNISGNSYEDKGLTPATEYEYKIIVVDQSGKESKGVTISFSTEVEIVEDKQPPADVTKTSWIRNGESPNITLSWLNPDEDDFSHVIIYKDDVLIQEKLEGTQYQDKISQALHVYKIVTVDKSGNESVGVEVTIATMD